MQGGPDGELPAGYLDRLPSTDLFKNRERNVDRKSSRLWVDKGQIPSIARRAPTEISITLTVKQESFLDIAHQSLDHGDLAFFVQGGERNDIHPQNRVCPDGEFIRSDISRTCFHGSYNITPKWNKLL